MLGFGNGGVVWAEQFMATGLVAVLVASAPFWMVGMEAFAGGERLTRRTVTGLSDWLLGNSSPGLARTGPCDLCDVGWKWVGGLVATQLACIGWSIGSTVSKQRLRDTDHLVSSAFQMLAGGVVMLTVGGLLGEFGRLSWSPRSLAALTYLTCAGSLVGFVAYTYALRHLPMSTVSLYPYVNPVVAVVLGTWLLHEPLTWRIVVAIAIILAGSAVVSGRAGTIQNSGFRMKSGANGGGSTGQGQDPPESSVQISAPERLGGTPRQAVGVRRFDELRGADRARAACILNLRILNFVLVPRSSGSHAGLSAFLVLARLMAWHPEAEEAPGCPALPIVNSEFLLVRFP